MQTGLMEIVFGLLKFFNYAFRNFKYITFQLLVILLLLMEKITMIGMEFIFQKKNLLIGRNCGTAIFYGLSAWCGIAFCKFRNLFRGVPEWLKGWDCKSHGSAFAGSNPAPSTIICHLRNDLVGKMPSTSIRET